MKRVSLMIAALALVLGISQCKKQEDPVGGKVITQKVTFTTSFGDGSKLGVTETGGTLDLKWQIGDEITVTDGAEHSSTLKCTGVTDGGKTGTFKGTITCIEDAELTFTVGVEPTYKNQHYKTIGEVPIYLKGTSVFKKNGDYGEIPMKLPYAILKVDLAELALESGSTDVSVKIDGNEVAKVTDVSASEHQFYLLLLLTVTDPTETTLTFDNNKGKTITKTYPLAANGFYTGGGTGGYAPIEPVAPDYLCFTAVEANSSVKLKKFGSPTLPDLVTSTDGKTWTDFTPGATTITLANIGDKVYFRRKGTEAGTSFSTDLVKYAYFVMTGKIAASGNVMSLLDPNCEVTAFDVVDGAYCFFKLFEGCTSLTKAPELPATTLAPACYIDMFNGCSSLNSITVHFTEWENTTTGWVNGVSSTGKFYCPSDLDEEYGEDCIPTGWTVEKF